MIVCVRVAFHEDDENHENDEKDEHNRDSYKQGVECWICGNHGNHKNYESHGNPGCKPRVSQTTGLEILEIWGETGVKFYLLLAAPECPGKQARPSKLH